MSIALGLRWVRLLSVLEVGVEEERREVWSMGLSSLVVRRDMEFGVFVVYQLRERPSPMEGFRLFQLQGHDCSIYEGMVGFPVKERQEGSASSVDGTCWDE